MVYRPFLPAMKADYLQFSQKTYVPLHLRPWWLDAVCGEDSWDVVMTADRGGAHTAAWPYFRIPLLSGVFTMIDQPPMTAYAGPWLEYPSNESFKLPSKYTFEKQILGDLIAQLPRVALFRQAFHPDVSSGLPLLWGGFRLNTRFTYRFDTPIDATTVRNGYLSDTRKKIARADRDFYVVPENAPELLWPFHRLSLERRGIRLPYGEEDFKRLHEALSARKQSALLVARERDSSRPVGVQYVAWDERRVHLLFGGLDRETGPTGHVNYLLLDAAIALAGGRGLGLDFEGSMDPGVEQVFRAFGAPLTPYYHAWRPGYRFMRWMYSLNKG